LEQFQAELAQLATQLEMAEQRASQTEMDAAENAEQLRFDSFLDKNWKIIYLIKDKGPANCNKRTRRSLRKGKG
jgi:hypothetical protein